MAGTTSPLTPVAEAVAKRRYFQKDDDGNIIEDWKSLVHRVVNHVCTKETEQFRNQIFELIYSTKFLPNSPCLVNAGTKVGGLLACFVSKSPEDSWVGMCENLANFGHIARRGGGCGVDFSQIRPEGAPVFGSTHAKACGPIKHMVVVSEAMNSITQAGFRGMANMGVLRVDHPDVFNFIRCKQRRSSLKYMLREDIFGHFDQFDKGDEPDVHDHANLLLDKFLSNFNISVLVTDEFMKAVEEDTDFELRFEDKPYRSVKAREIFDLIVENAWRNGDPGVLFYDTVNSGPYRYSGQIISATNPCVTGDTIVLTSAGPIQIKEMVGKPHTLVTRDANGRFSYAQTSGSFLTKKKAKILKIETENSVIRCTPDHKIMTTQGMKAGETIKPGEMILSNPCGLGVSYGLENSSREKWKGVAEEFQRVSQNASDGEEATHIVVSQWVRSEKNHPDDIIFWMDLLDVKEIFSGREYAKAGTRCCDSKNQGDAIKKCSRTEESVLPLDKQTGISPKNKKIQLRLVSLTDCGESIFAKFLRMDNGDVLRFKGSKLENRSARLCSPEWRNIQTRLLHLLKEWKVEEDCRSEEQVHDGIARIQSGDAEGGVCCASRVGHRYHTICSSFFEVYSQMPECLERVVRVAEEEKLEDVYDLTVDNSSHNFIANGFVVHNCGEQPLPQWGSCNLGSIDISKFYDGTMNWKDLRTAIETAVRFLDCVMDINVFPTPEFEKWAKENRPVGLGIMGFADLLLKMEIAYGSDESLKIADKIAKTFKTTAHEVSVALAQEKGTPKSCRYDELDNRRNATTLTIAPTGSISLLAGCSGAIEPIFAPVTFRYDNTGSYEMPHPEAKKSYFRCALDKEQDGKREVKWQEHVAIQAAFQKHVDSSISKTINMPNSATKEDVAEAYVQAWKSGCKGITIYRDGCKSTQVLNTEKQGLSTVNAVCRPKEVNCDIHKTTALGCDWHVIVGKVQDSPYEVFAVNGKVDLPEKGTVIKRKKRHYSLVDEEGNILIDNLNSTEELIDPKLGLETRRFSLELRHGIHPKYIVQQIDKSTEYLTSFSKAVGRIFKRHYLSPEDCCAIAIDIACPKCAKNGDQIEMMPKSSCWECPKCNYSQCG